MHPLLRTPYLRYLLGINKNPLKRPNSQNVQFKLRFIPHRVLTAVHEPLDF